MLRISFACALLAAGAPAAFGKYVSGSHNTEETSEANGVTELRKLDLGKLRLGNLVLDRLNTEKPVDSFTEFKLDLPTLSQGLGIERLPLQGHGSASPPEGKSSLKVDLKDLKQHLGHRLPPFKSMINIGGSEETPPLAPPFPETAVSEEDTETHTSMNRGESLGRIGQLFKHRDSQKVIPSLSWVGRREQNGFHASGHTLVHDAAASANSDENDSENKSPAATLSSNGKPPMVLVPGRFNRPTIVPELASDKLELLKFPKLSPRQGSIDYQTESTQSSKSEALDSDGAFRPADVTRAPPRRLNLLPALGNALQRIDRKTKKRDEEALQAFELGVKQLQTDVKEDLASALGTRRRPADPVFVERVLAKVGLNGLGGPAPIDLSLQERAIMEQARRRRPQVEKIKSKYERDVKNLVNELHGSLRGAHNYKQRISDIVNQRMYTGTALLPV